jgi:hypothetical protein
MPEELTAYWQAEVPALRVTTVPGCNHYTIICAPQAAAVVAGRIAAPELS